jgi:hypothetical protein
MGWGSEGNNKGAVDCMRCKLILRSELLV